MSTQDRPTPRQRPRPAPDAGADPADPTPLASEPTPVARTAAPTPVTPGVSASLPLAQMLRLTSGPTRQLGVRISEPIYDLLARTSAETGIKPRQLIEYAITRVFATEEGQREWHER